MWIIGIIAIVAIIIFVKKFKSKKSLNTQEETNCSQRQEERSAEKEAERYNPGGKSLEWFCSEDGLKTFNEYMTANNYLLEERLQKEKEEKYQKYDFDLFVSVVHKDAKLPYMFFKNLINNIETKILDYVAPMETLINILSLQAKPFYIDDDGEPQPKDRYFLPEEIVSVEKNAILNYTANFKCFELQDDTQGTWEDKWNMWETIIFWLSKKSFADKNVISNNPWVFLNETYLNDLGTARKLKGFYKKCIELVSEKEDKEYFEEKLKECE